MKVLRPLLLLYTRWQLYKYHVSDNFDKQISWSIITRLLPPSYWMWSWSYPILIVWKFSYFNIFIDTPYVQIFTRSLIYSRKVSLSLSMEVLGLVLRGEDGGGWVWSKGGGVMLSDCCMWEVSWLCWWWVGEFVNDCWGDERCWGTCVICWYVGLVGSSLN